jgi:hypothetical protein
MRMFVYRSVLILVAALAVTACGTSPTTPDPATNSLFGVARITGSEVLLEGVVVWVGSVRDETTIKGDYFLDELDLGEVRVFAEFPGYEQYSRRVLIREGGNTHDIFLVALP